MSLQQSGRENVSNRRTWDSSDRMPGKGNHKFVIGCNVYKNCKFNRVDKVNKIKSLLQEFHPMLTDRGLCYTFNSDSMQKLFKQTKYLDTLKKHLTDWQGHKHDEEGNLKEPLMISTIEHSVRLVLDTQSLG